LNRRERDRVERREERRIRGKEEEENQLEVKLSERLEW
jgi:hypothetical protein